MKARKWYNFTLAAFLILLAPHSTTAFAESNKNSLKRQSLPVNDLSSPQKVRLTNVRDTQFTVSWVTSGKTVGKINYGPTPALGKTAYDDRGRNIGAGVHHVTVRHLKPNTLYSFVIVSGNRTYKNGKELYTCQTGPTIIPAECDVAYGRVYQGLSKKRKIPYGREAVVYLTLIDENGAGSSGESATESTILEKNGYWSRELANFRKEGLSQLFNYSNSGDTLKIEVQTGVHPQAEIIVDTNSDSPAKDIVLKRGK